MVVNTILSFSFEHLIDLIPDKWAQLVDDIMPIQILEFISDLKNLPDHKFAFAALIICVLLFLVGRSRNNKGAVPPLEGSTAPDSKDDANRRQKRAMAAVLKLISDALLFIPGFVGENTHDPTKPIPEGKSADAVYTEEGSLLLFVYSTAYWLIVFVLALFLKLNNCELFRFFILIPIALLCLLASSTVKQRNNLGIIIDKIKGIFQRRPSKSQNPIPEAQPPAEKPTVQKLPVSGKEQP